MNAYCCFPLACVVGAGYADFFLPASNATIVEEEALVLDQTGLRWVIWLSVMSQARQKRHFAHVSVSVQKLSLDTELWKTKMKNLAAID